MGQKKEKVQDNQRQSDRLEIEQKFHSACGITENLGDKQNSSRNFKLAKQQNRGKNINSNIRQNFMKSDEQLAILQNEYAKNQQWNSEILTRACKKTGLLRVQVYKWYWDRKEELMRIQKERQELCEKHFEKLFKVTKVKKHKTHFDQGLYSQSRDNNFKC
ncbi:UNKNOWN [Stylonychia lemnae]|uniref:Homeobox domain-containing protein n=1 Tax=Stylonychia lemnae TaxID=5949 RepID=A0A077ZPH9_STYLE|nr:UNKNOWN [Stylonychia lemnae]|eukprot:CDW71349.1 UNKNOWN [Stylonychia lemnae]